MNGYDVARAVRIRGGTRHIRLITLTGWGQVDDRQRALDAGFDAHVTKPPDVRVLLREIAK